MNNSESKLRSGSRPKKPKFHGNRFTSSKVKQVQSASEKKLVVVKPIEEVVASKFAGYRLVDISFLLNEISEHLSCKKCGGDIVMQEVLIVGLSSKFEINCANCENISAFRSCPMLGKHKSVAEVNRRAVYAMRCIGQGYEGLSTFCGVMDLPVPLSRKSYDVIVQRLVLASKNVATISMKDAANEERNKTGSDSIIVSGDGTWKTRGHSSNIGVCTVVGDLTGKIIDVEVMSKYCKACDSWKGEKKGAEYRSWKNLHAPYCTKNHTGSSGKMEVDGMVRIFSRSKAEREVMYAKYIGDGDCKTFTAISDSDPYGPLVKVEKIECVGHIQKRMGTQLRKLKAKMGKTKLSDGKGLGGRGRLTDAAINMLTSFFGKAIIANKNSLIDMKMGIWALFHHTRSSDLYPTHDFCPKGKDSWCKYQRAVVDNTVSKFKHKKSLPTAVMDCIKPVFKNLSSPDLLRRCLGGKTQNKNESVNALIWKMCPKISGCGRRIAKIAVNEAIVAFNEGKQGRLLVMKDLEFLLSQHSISAAKNADVQRIKTSKIRCKAASLQARRAKRLATLAQNENLKLKEGVVYEAGGF